MKPVRRFVAAMLVVAVMCCSSIARAQVLDQVPEQALIVVKVTNLAGFSTKFAKFATDLQLVSMLPPLGDPLATLQERLKIQKGLDKAGDVAFAYLDPAVADGNEEESMLLLIPVTDYKEFLTNFPGSTEEGGISQVALPDAPAPAYVASWGKYAVVSPSKAIASLKPTGVKVAGATAKELAGKDIVLLANLPQIKGKLQPELEKARGEAAEGIERDLTGDKAKWAPTAKVAVNQLLNVADAFLRDAQFATVAVNFTESGINSTVMTDFAPTSYLGGITSSTKNSDASLLTGLPAGKYLAFGGSTNDPAQVVKLVDDLINPILTELKKVEGPEAVGVVKYVDSFRAYMAATTGQNFAMIAPTGALGQEPIIQVVSIQHGNPAAIKTAYADMMTTQQELMKAVGLGQEAVKVTQTPNAKTVEGVSFDLVHTDFSFGDAPNAAQADQAMKMIYGPDGMNAYTGVVGNELVMGFGVNDAALAGVITAIKAKDDPISKLPGVALVNAQLPNSRALTLYIPLDEIVTTIGTYVGAMGMPIQIQLPPDLPPIGITAGTEGSAMRFDSYTPTDLIKALVAQGMQLYMQRMGGAGGPGGL